jgi:hypothetical protein
VTEPASSEFFPDEDEAARIGSSGQPSSDFQQDSLPPDYVMSMSNLSGTEKLKSIVIYKTPWVNFTNLTAQMRL